MYIDSYFAMCIIRLQFHKCPNYFVFFLFIMLTTDLYWKGTIRTVVARDGKL